MEREVKDQTYSKLMEITEKTSGAKDISEAREILTDEEYIFYLIAKKAGIPENIFCMMLNDKRRIEVNEYMRICDALGVPLEKFRMDTTKSC